MVDSLFNNDPNSLTTLLPGDHNDLKIEGIEIENFKFKDLNFLNIFLYQSRFKDVTFEGCNFNTHSHLADCQFIDCIFVNCTFDNSNLDGLHFIDSELIDSKFNFIEFNTPTFFGTSFIQTVFLNTSINSGEILESTESKDVIFEGVFFSRTTIEEFDCRNLTINHSQFSYCRLYNCHWDQLIVEEIDFVYPEIDTELEDGILRPTLINITNSKLAVRGKNHLRTDLFRWSNLSENNKLEFYLETIKTIISGDIIPQHLKLLLSCTNRVHTIEPYINQNTVFPILSYFNAVKDFGIKNKELSYLRHFLNYFDLLPEPFFTFVQSVLPPHDDPSLNLNQGNALITFEFDLKNVTLSHTIEILGKFQKLNEIISPNEPFEFVSSLRGSQNNALLVTGENIAVIYELIKREGLNVVVTEIGDKFQKLIEQDERLLELKIKKKEAEIKKIQSEEMNEILKMTRELAELSGTDLKMLIKLITTASEQSHQYIRSLIDKDKLVKATIIFGNFINERSGDLSDS